MCCYLQTNGAFPLCSQEGFIWKMMVNASQAVCFEPISTKPLEKRGTPSSPSPLVSGLAWPVLTSPQAGPSRESGHRNHPFLPSLCLKMVFPSSYVTYTILQIDGFTGTSGWVWENQALHVAFFPLTFAALFLPVWLLATITSWSSDSLMHFYKREANLYV